MPSNLILPSPSGGGREGHLRPPAPRHISMAVATLAHLVLWTAAHVMAVYIMVLATQEATSHPMHPTVESNDQAAFPPLLNRYLRSRDFNLLQPSHEGTDDAQLLQEQTSGIAKPSALLVVPLLIALADRLSRCCAFLVVRRRRHVRNAVQGKEENSSNCAFLFLAPIIALSAAAASTALSTVYVEQLSGVSVFFTPLLALRGLTWLILDMLFPSQDQAGDTAQYASRTSRPYMAAAVVIGVAGLCWLSSALSSSFVFTSLPLLAVLSALGPWLQQSLKLDVNAQFQQSLVASLVLANLLHAIDKSLGALLIISPGLLALFALLSFGAAVLESAAQADSATVNTCLIACDVFAYVVLGFAGFSDSTSSVFTKTAYFVVLGLYAIVNCGGSNSASRVKGNSVSKVDGGSDLLPASAQRTTSLSLQPISLLVALVSLLTAGLAFSDIQSVSSSIPTSSLPQESSRVDSQHKVVSRAHLTYPNPNNLDPRYEFSGTLVIDTSLSAIAHHGRKSARVFALNATDTTSTDADDRVLFQVRVPTLDRWPERPWDRVAQQSSWRKKAFGQQGSPQSVNGQPAEQQQQQVTLDELAFGAAVMDSGDVATSLANMALAAGTFASFPSESDDSAGKVNYQVFWSSDDDPVAMRGKEGYLVKAFRKLTKGTGVRGPVIMRGEPNQLEHSRNRTFFNMLPYLYLTAPPTTRWFLLGTDTTIWFPSNVLSFLNELPIDPIETPAFFADPSPRTHSIAGGGIIISRALAGLIHKHASRTCLIGVDGVRGDDLLRNCIDLVMRLTSVSAAATANNSVHSTTKSTFQHHQVRTLTRLPMFNSVDMHNPRRRDDGIDMVVMSGHSYLSARLSRAAPFTLHNILALPPAQFGLYNRRYAAYKLWHLVSQLPKALQFRRFFIHLDPHHHGTAVVTYGLSVRVYEMKINELDHSVDLDDEFLPVDQVGGINWVVDERLGPAKSDEENEGESSWPRRHNDYEDYWLAEVNEVEGTMLYVSEQLKRKFMLRVQCATSAADAGAGDRSPAMAMYAMSCSR